MTCSSRNLDHLQGTSTSTPSTLMSMHLTIKLALDFLTIIWHSKAEDLITDKIASSFLTSSMEFLRQRSFNSCHSSLVRDSLVNCLSVVARCGIFDGTSPIEYAFIWNLVMHSRRADFVAACMFHGLLSTIYSKFKCCLF